MEQKKFEFSEANYDSGLDNDMSQMDMKGNSCFMANQNMMCEPIEECPQERVCHRYFCYEVPHIMPCNTRIINHHVYKHTYKPCYSCCEENVCENIYGPKCCF